MIVSFQPGVTDEQINDFYEDFGLSENDDLNQDGQQNLNQNDGEQRLVVVPGEVSNGLITQLESDARVEYAERNYLLFADDVPTPSDRQRQ